MQTKLSTGMSWATAQVAAASHESEWPDVVLVANPIVREFNSERKLVLRGIFPDNWAADSWLCRSRIGNGWPISWARAATMSSSCRSRLASVGKGRIVNARVAALLRHA
jgi:hypothetical protein